MDQKQSGREKNRSKKWGVLIWEQNKEKAQD